MKTKLLFSFIFGLIAICFVIGACWSDSTVGSVIFICLACIACIASLLILLDDDYMAGGGNIDKGLYDDDLNYR